MIYYVLALFCFLLLFLFCISLFDDIFSVIRIIQMIHFQLIPTICRHRNVALVSIRNRTINSMVNQRMHLHPVHHQEQECVDGVYVQRAVQVMIVSRFRDEIPSIQLVSINKYSTVFLLDLFYVPRSTGMVRCNW
jgi:hypothetical protein